jgi:hypothetical protein
MMMAPTLWGCGDLKADVPSFDEIPPETLSLWDEVSRYHVAKSFISSLFSE